MKTKFAIAVFAAVAVLSSAVFAADVESVKLYNGGVEVAAYTTLNEALSNAAECEAPSIVLTAPSRLGLSAEVVTSCEIDGAGFSVNAGNSSIAVLAGARVLMRDISIVTERDTAIAVAPGGVLAVAGAVEVGKVSIPEGAGFELADAITKQIVIASPSIAFGTYTCSQSIAESCANLLINAEFGDELEAVATGGNLRWAPAAVAGAEAAVRLDQSGTSVNFRSLRTLAKFAENGSTAVVLKNCALDATVPVGVGMTLRGNSSGLKVTASGCGAFAIAGGSLVVSNLAFAGETTDAIFHVGSGSQSGQLTLARNAVVDGVVGKNANHGGVVYVENGVARLNSGSAIRNCRANGYGGGAYAENAGSSIVIAGGSVTGCSAMKGGGGVKAWDGAKVVISGASRVIDNTKPGGIESDIDVELPVEVAGTLTGGEGSVGVRLSDRNSAGSEEGDEFATYAQSMTAAQAAQSAKAFVNTEDEDLFAEARTSGRKFAWKAVAVEVAQKDAVAKVSYSGGATHWYASVNDAFSAIEGDCTVELLSDGCELDGSVVVGYDVTLRTATSAGAQFSIVRADGCIIVETSGRLTLSDVCISGGASDGEGGGPLVEVAGGELVLAGGATLCNLASDTTRADSAVVVYNSGTFEMRDGATVENCANGYVDSGAGYNSGAGGGVLVDGRSTARFLGGSVVGCSATFGGGVCICNQSVAYVSGSFTVVGNTKAGGDDASDFLVEDLSSLYVAGPLSDAAEIGAICGFRADTNLVACVEGWRDWDFATLTNSAARFFSDERPVVRGFLVTNDTDKALVVWSTAIAKDGSFTSVDGETFFAAGKPPVIETEDEFATPEPIEFSAIEGNADSTMWTLRLTNAVQWCEYSIYATDSLEGGFQIDGAKPVTNFQWKSSAREIELTLPAEGPQRFWRAKAEAGVVGE